MCADGLGLGSNRLDHALHPGHTGRDDRDGRGVMVEVINEITN